MTILETPPPPPNSCIILLNFICINVIHIEWKLDIKKIKIAEDRKLKISQVISCGILVYDLEEGRRQLGPTAPLPVHLCRDLKVQEG